LDEGSGESINGQGHTNQIVQMVSQGNKIVSVGMDDKVKVIDITTKTFNDSSVPTEALTKGIISVNDDDDKIIIATLSNIQIIQNNKSIFSHPLSTSSPKAIAFNKYNNELAVGCEDAKVYIYKLSDDGNKLEEKNENLVDNQGSITAIAYSPDGSLIAVGDSQGKVFVYDDKTKKNKNKSMDITYC
jgi:WD40 repeat protein